MRMFNVNTMYNAVLTVIVSKPGEAVYWMEKHGLGKDFGKLYDADAAFLDRGLTLVIWLPKWEDALFVHEAVHFAVHVVKSRLRVKKLHAADESVAWIVEDVFRKSSKKNKGKK